MSKKTLTITDFQERGITDELYGSSGFGMVAGFETTRANRLQPTMSLTTAAALASGTITDANIFTFTEISGSSVGVYGLGVAGAYGSLYKWDENNTRFVSHATLGTTGTLSPVLVPYHGYFHGYNNTTNYVWRGEFDGSPVPDDWQAESATIVDIVHHTGRDYLYFLGDNEVHQYDGTTYNTSAVLTLGTDFTCVKGSQSGIYTLIGGTIGETSEVNVVWWDGDSGLTDVTAVNTLQNGVLKHILRTNKMPLAIILENNELRIYQLSLSGAILINRLKADTIVVGKGFEYDDRAHLALSLTNGSSTVSGIASIDEFGRIIMEHYSDDSTSNVGGAYRSKLSVNNYRTFLSDFSTSNVYYGSGPGSGSHLETRMYRASTLNDQLDFSFATVRTEPLPSGGVVTLKYRNSVSDSFTTLATFSTDGEIKHTITKLGATNKPSISPEIQFRLESTGNAVINGFYAELDEVSKDPA